MQILILYETEDKAYSIVKAREKPTRYVKDRSGNFHATFKDMDINAYRLKPEQIRFLIGMRPDIIMIEKSLYEKISQEDLNIVLIPMQNSQRLKIPIIQFD
jgi:hypothetical protein